MTFFSILCVLILEQFRALPVTVVRAWERGHAGLLERLFNGGTYRHGVTAWLVGVGLPSLLVLGVDYALYYLHPVLSFIFGVAVVYLTIGFRQFSHFYTDIQIALRMGELERARALLAEWRGRHGDRLGSADIVRLAIEQGILAAQRHVFAPLFWFVLLGPAGAILYRLSLGFGKEAPAIEDFGAFAGKMLEWLDWIPTRLTAITFAVVGDFEDALYCWRSQAAQWPDASSGILLASGAGALGIKLGLPLPDALETESRPELGLGEDVELDHLQSAIGLVWRALVLCVLLLGLLTLARWVGG